LLQFKISILVIPGEVQLSPESGETA